MKREYSSQFPRKCDLPPVKWSYKLQDQNGFPLESEKPYGLLKFLQNTKYKGIKTTIIKDKKI